MNVAFIPVRGGSKSIPYKNIKRICGKPLVYWVIKAACDCEKIDKVYVATDSQRICDAVGVIKLETGVFDKVEVIGRSQASATDTASTEFAMLEFAEKHFFETITLIQATSPLLMGEDLDRGFEKFFEEGTDSVLSVVRQKRFNWKMDENGFVVPTNYDVYHRPRRQEFDGYLVENGAFYITRREDLLKTKNRVSGNIRAVEMCEESFFEIDEISDWAIIEELMKKKNEKVKIPIIKMFLTDCDGCLTDGGMYYSENGDELKKFNTKDGMGFKLLKENNIITGIVTGESVDLNRRRAEKLKLDILESGCTNKLDVVKSLCKQNNIALENVAYVGDDINDIEVLKNVGFGCCPKDANEKVKKYSKYIASVNGGNGVIREIVDKILEK